MQPSLFFTSALLLLSGLTAAHPRAEPSDLDTRSTSKPSKLPFSMEHIFTANINLSHPSKHIPTSGGVIVTEAIPSGSVSGSALNGTIKGGLAYPSVIAQGTVQVPHIVIYGNTDDGAAFSIVEEGIGSPDAQVTRIKLSVGGGSKYEKLRNGYILASVNPSQDRSKVAVEGYLVTNIA